MPLGLAAVNSFRRGLAVAMPLGLAAAIFFAVTLLAAGPAAAQEVLSAALARERQLASKVTIVDIRRPEEWRDTGLPAGAARATILSPLGNLGFLKRIVEITGGDKTMPIALICAAGARSRHAAKLLGEKGYTRVTDIREGMYGSRAGPGWLRRRLPLEICDDC